MIRTLPFFQNICKDSRKFLWKILRRKTSRKTRKRDQRWEISRREKNPGRDVLNQTKDTRPNFLTYICLGDISRTVSYLKPWYAWVLFLCSLLCTRINRWTFACRGSIKRTMKLFLNGVQEFVNTIKSNQLYINQTYTQLEQASFEYHWSGKSSE